MCVLVSRSAGRPFEEERFGRAWEWAGGARDELVFVVPGEKPWPAGDGAVTGVLLTGGPDVEPSRYGAAPEPGVELTLDPARDEQDMELLAAAERQAWPVLAVCYGCQLLAVAAGGTLIQDLPSSGLAGHAIDQPKDFLAHEVAIDTAARFLPGRGTRLAVNSRHHQAVGSPGSLQVVATAPDGVIEAVETGNGERFVLGVQWHPENMRTDRHVAVFAAFRLACRSRGRG